MITILKSGEYKLIETKHHTKVLYLDNEIYAWIHTKNIGEILVSSRHSHRTDCVLSAGRYYLYDVQEEPYLSDQLHLELETGQNAWQGYVLLTGLPDAQKQRSRIIPTAETITGNRRFQLKKDVYKNLARTR